MHGNKRIYIAGHRGMVGSALVRQLQQQANTEIITRTHAELDLTAQAAVREFFQQHPLDEVYLAAARVGGIHKLLFLGSSCIYPKLAPQPMREDALLTNTLESTNEPYAIAKIAG